MYLPIFSVIHVIIFVNINFLLNGISTPMRYVSQVSRPRSAVGQNLHVLGYRGFQFVASALSAQTRGRTAHNRKGRAGGFPVCPFNPFFFFYSSPWLLLFPLPFCLGTCSTGGTGTFSSWVGNESSGLEKYSVNNSVTR